MGKRLEDLHLTDQPLTPPAPSDPRGTDWYRFTQDIEDLLTAGEHTWAADTLLDIQQTVERTQRVTEGQRAAVDNIGNARRNRRYEGHRRW